MVGAELFVEGLRGLGYEPTVLSGHSDHVVIDYVIEVGRFKGQKVRIGFVVPPDFPAIPPSGPNVSPKFYPNALGGNHPTGGIHDARTAAFGGDFQYWSRPFSDWARSKKNVAVYMAHIWRLWETQ